MLDRVVAKAGEYPDEYFDDETNAALEKIPSLTSRMDSSGHLELSKESIMAEEPDLIIGQSETVNPETTIETALVQEPGFCGEVKNASFDDVYDHIDLYGTLFAKEDEAQKNQRRGCCGSGEDRLGRRKRQDRGCAVPRH